MPAGPVPHPGRSLLRISVRGLILFVIVAGAGLGWIVRQAHMQRDAVAAIRKAGGRAAYSWESDHGKAIRGGKPWAPSWVLESIGVDFFGHVTDVELEGSSRPADTVLAAVGRLNRLQRLSLEDTSATDAGLMHLAELTDLFNLNFRCTPITDAGLVHLKGLTKLSSVVLHGTQVTDAGLVHLKGLTNLSYLRLDGTQVTDAGLVHLGGLTKLSDLWLNDTQVTDCASLSAFEGTDESLGPPALLTLRSPTRG